MRVLSIATLILMCAVLSTNAFAQTSDGTLFGTTRNATYTLISGVTITATNPGTGFVTSVISNESGAFQITPLQTGTYKVVFELPGYQKVIYNDIALGAAQQVQLNIVLQARDAVQGASSSSYVVLNQGTLVCVSIDSERVTFQTVGVIGGYGQGGYGLAVDAFGNYIVAIISGLIRVTPSGAVSVIASAPAGSGWISVAVDTNGNYIVGDNRQHALWRVSARGSTVTKVTNYPVEPSPVSEPSIAIDDSGNYLLMGIGARYFHKITPDGVDTRIALTGATTSPYNSSGFIPDGAGNYLVNANDGVYRVTPTGVVSQFAKFVGSTFFPSGLARDPDTGEIVVSIYSPPHQELLRISPDGSKTSLVYEEVYAPLRYLSRLYGVVAVPIGVSASRPFSINNRGGISLTSSGSFGSATVGWGEIRPESSNRFLVNSTPSGLAIFGFRQNSVLITEVGVPALPTIQFGRIYTEVNGPVNTGVAMANPNDQPATVSFFFTNQDGDFANGSTTIPANGQIAAFFNESPFNGGSFLSGTFTFSSTIPIAVVALRGLSNERGEYLITTLPVVDLSAPPTARALVFPHFANGGGWTTQIVLVNPGETSLTGTVQFVNSSGGAATVSVNNQLTASVAYSIPARSAQKLQTAGSGAAVQSGSVRVVPGANTAAPSGLAVFSFRSGGITVAEAGVPAVSAGTVFRLYAEASGDFGHGVIGSIQTGLGVVNTSASAATVTLELSKLDGSSTGLSATLSIPANGQVATFLNQIPGFGSLQTPFQGVLRVTGSTSISVTGLRGRYNERRDFLITTTPAVNEAAALTTVPLYFPHIVDSGGYTTQFILFSGQSTSVSSGTIQLFSQSGAALNIPLQ